MLRICNRFEHKRERNQVAQRRRPCSSVAQAHLHPPGQLPPAAAGIERTVEGRLGKEACLQVTGREG
jgi:hypothetical protein